MILKYLLRKTSAKTTSMPEEADCPSAPSPHAKDLNWPVHPDRQRVNWYPAKQRLIGLVREHKDGFVLPPAVVRKATWQE